MKEYIQNTCPCICINMYMFSSHYIHIRICINIYIHVCIYTGLEDYMKGYIQDAQAIQKIFINTLAKELSIKPSDLTGNIRIYM
jgi:hypothetical protein